MGVLQEKEIRGYQMKEQAFVCPVCATEEEIKAASEEKILYKEDEVHDDKGTVCIRCKKEI